MVQISGDIQEFQNGKGGGRVECLGSAGDYIDALPSNAMFCECEE